MTRLPEEKTPMLDSQNMVVNSTKIRRWKRRKIVASKNKSAWSPKWSLMILSGRTFFGLNGIIVESCVLYCTDLSKGSEFRVCIRTWCFRCYVSFIYIYIGYHFQSTKVIKADLLQQQRCFWKPRSRNLNQGFAYNFTTPVARVYKDISNW